jgi:acyl-CoA thioesterase FadM
VAIRIRFDEAGPSGIARPSTLLRHAADLAWIHSERIGFGRAWYAERGLLWLVRGVELRVLGPIRDGDALTGTTEVMAVRRVLARRRIAFHGASGELAAVALVDYALILASGQPTRIPAYFGTAFGVENETFEPTRVRVAAPPEACTLSLAVRPQELDPMAHVNNAVYLDWVEEAILAAGERDQASAPDLAAVPRRYRLEYLAAAGPGQRLEATVWRADAGGWACRIADSATGAPILGALVES